VRVEDEHLEPLVRALVVTDCQPREPTATMRYDVLGCAPYTVLEEGDRLASGVTGLEAVATIAERCRARLINHLALGGWMAAEAGIVWIERERSLVLAGQGTGPAIPRRVRSDEVEGDELVFFRGGEAVCLPQPHARCLRLAPVDKVVIAENQPGAGAITPVPTGEALRILAGTTLTPSAPRARLIAECVALVGKLDAYRLE
jgi:hypothetical protein